MYVCVCLTLIFQIAPGWSSGGDTMKDLPHGAVWEKELGDPRNPSPQLQPPSTAIWSTPTYIHIYLTLKTWKRTEEKYPDFASVNANLCHMQRENNRMHSSFEKQRLH